MSTKLGREIMQVSFFVKLPNANKQPNLPDVMMALGILVLWDEEEVETNL